MLTPNTILQDRYLIVRLLAQGGMGAVYEARDQRLGNTVALKETFFTDESMRHAFHREASMLAGLRHQSLPKVMDHFTEGNGQFLVMEYIRGDDLGKLLEMHGRAIPPPDVLAWGDQLLGALEYLHAQHPPVIHRDIKPQNLKLNERGEVILLDFGLAKGAASQLGSQASLSVRGYTLTYAPLEQIQGLGTDPRSDLYSVAATLYHLITGVVPPDAVSRAAAIVGSQPDPLRPADEINPLVSPAVATVLQQAMAQDRNQRFASATVMRAALRHAASGSSGPVPAAPDITQSPRFNPATVQGVPNPITQPRSAGPAGQAAAPAMQLKEKPSGRRWLLPGALAAAAALILIAIITLWFIRQPSSPGENNAAASSNPKKPTPLTTRELISRGNTEDRYYSFTAGPGEIKMTLDILANGATVSVEVLDGENSKLNFDQRGATFSLTSGNHHEQDTARILLDREQPVVMKVSNNYPKDLNAYRLRLDGAVKLPKGGDSATSPLATVFADRDRPQPLVANPIFGGQGTNKDLYYGFTAGPGEIKLTLNVIANGSATSIELFGSEAEKLRFENGATAFSLTSSGHNEQEVAKLLLDRRQPVLMRIINSYPKDVRAYRLRFEGPVETAQDSSGTAAKVAEALSPLFADRDQPEPLKSKELSGRGSEKDLYYTFAAGPGVVKLTLEVEGNGAGLGVELFDKEAKKILFENNANSFSLTSSNKPEQKGTSFTLDRELPVVMRLTYNYPRDLKNYRLQLDGPVKTAQ